MNLGTLVVGAILLVVVGLVVASMVRAKKNGKSLQCGCGCEKCDRNCR